MNKPIPTVRRRLPEFPRINVVLTWSDGSKWLNGWDLLCWIGTACLIGGTYALLR